MLTQLMVVLLVIKSTAIRSKYSLKPLSKFYWIYMYEAVYDNFLLYLNLNKTVDINNKISCQRVQIVSVPKIIAVNK